MSFIVLAKLADKFAAKLQKLAEDQYELISDKLSKIVESLVPFVADNNLQDKKHYYEITIELMSSPSDQESLSEKEFDKLIQLTINTLKSNFKVSELSVEDTSNSFAGNTSAVTAIKVKVEKI